MWSWMRKLFSQRRRAENSASVSGNFTANSKTAQDEYRPLALSQLYVQPDEMEDFDAEACRRLLAAIADAGATNVDDLGEIAVRIEDFFEGNRCRNSIATNIELSPPFHTSAGWYELLKRIRATAGVDDVLIGISMIEPDEDGRLGVWPYSDTVWIYSSQSRDAVAALAAPLQPDEVRDASVDDPEWDLTPPRPAPSGVTPYWIWWD